MLSSSLALASPAVNHCTTCLRASAARSVPVIATFGRFVVVERHARRVLLGVDYGSHQCGDGGRRLLAGAQLTDASRAVKPSMDCY